MKISEGTRKLAQALLQPINPASVIILGVYTVVWGLWVANPFWSVFGQAKLFSTLALVAPEPFWGTIAIICGIVTVIGALKRSYRPLVRGAHACGWHWFMISIFYFIGDPLNTGGITALTFAIVAAYIYLNLRVNFKDDQHNQEILDPRRH